jgi:DNA end-binding protein Ku
VESLAADWSPGKYTDDYSDNLMRLIRAKAKGQSIEVSHETRSQPPKVVDLMERLRRSLEQSAGRHVTRRPAAKGRSKTARARRPSRRRAA